MLIAFCGIDGAGKTTQINLLKEYFERNGKEVFLTKQPTSFYRNYDRFRKYVNYEVDSTSNNILYELALLSASDKIRHYETEILPNSNKIVLSDRYVFSAYAYFIARGISDCDWLCEINKYMPLPSFTFYLDMDPSVAYERIINRDGKYTKKEETDIAMLTSVRNVFLNQPWGKTYDYHIISASSRSIMDIHAEIVGIVNNYIGENNDKLSYN